MLLASFHCSPRRLNAPPTPMARPRLSGVLPSVLPLALALSLALLAGPAIAFAPAPEPSTTGSRFPPLLDCAPAPSETDVAFRANVLALLRAVPSSAAAAPTGFAAARSSGSGRGRDRAFARALCFGARNKSSSSRACRACLSAAARDATATTGGCGTSRRAAVWRAGCFLAYADTDAPSPREAAFRGWFYAGPNTTLADRVCAGDRTAAECGRCFEDAARAAGALGWLARIRGQEVVVVGYGCALRVRISVLPQGSVYSDEPVVL